MSIKHDLSSAYVQERRKWETRPVMIDTQYIGPQIVDGKMRPGFTDGTYIEPLPREQGGRYPYIYQEYPKMLYKAHRADGGPKVDLDSSGTRIVHSEGEERSALASGWHDGQEAAIQAIHDEDQNFAKLAAERAAQERRMSAKAQAEAAAVDESTIQHVPSIPETPIKPRGVK